MGTIKLIVKRFRMAWYCFSLVRLSKPFFIYIKIIRVVVSFYYFFAEKYHEILFEINII